jgi:Porin subfamily
LTLTTRSLLVASLLAALAVAGASAAELPTTRSEPAKNVRKCNVAGMEGVLLPGSNVCVKVGGYVSGGVAAGNISK